MATEGGNRGPGLIGELTERPFRFRFFQAVRLLRLDFLRRRQPASRDVDFFRRAVRFHTHASLEFPASEIQDISRPEDDPEVPAKSDVTVNFIGLTGPSGALPQHYTEMIVARAQLKKDHTAHDFFDLFSHRLTSLFHLAWEKYRFWVGYERGERGLFVRQVLDFVGLGTGGLPGRMGRGRGAVSDESMAFYGGPLARLPRSASAIAAVLADYFGCQVAIEPCRGRWLRIEEPDLTKPRSTGGNNALGVNAVLGDRAWDRQSSFRVCVGPLSLPDFLAFLPGGERFAAAQRMIRFATGAPLDWDFQYLLRDVPPCVMTSDPSKAPRLGWTTWAGTRPFNRPVESVIVKVNYRGAFDDQ